jgi:hypothetical protein
MNKKLKLILILGAMFLSPTAAVHADMAPPAQPPGSLPEPGKNPTMVQMVSELVTISIAGSGPLYYGNINHQAVNAEVRALFTMQNQGSQNERIKARFPLSSNNRWGDGYANNPEIQGLRIWVDQAAMKWTTSQEPLSSEKDAPVIRWANFEINFPAGKAVVVDMSYRLQSTGWLPKAEFSYLLQTGADWHGPIGEGEIDLILPYDAVEGENINLKESSPGGQPNGNTVTWKFTNLEPTATDNWHAQLIDPETWKSMLDLRKKLKGNPEDADTLSALSEGYSGIIFGKGLWNLNPGFETLVRQCREVSQKLAGLRPKDAPATSAYAGILFAMHQYPDRFSSDLPGTDEVFSALNQAYLLNPENWEIAQMYKDLTSQGNKLPLLGSTPIATLNPPPLQTIPATPTILQAGQTKGNGSDAPLFLIIGALILAAGILIGILIQSKMKKH